MDHRPVATETLLKQLHWRYATKKFDPAKKISPSDLETLEQTINLAPTSYGLQPFRVFIISDPDLRVKLRAAAWNQAQVTDASHLVVFARKLTITAEDVDHYLHRISEVRGAPVESLEGYRQMMTGDLINGPRAAIAAEWAARQAYIALGELLTSAAALGIDACPMEGFDPSQYDQILGLPAKGLGAVVQCALGYRAEDDHYAALKKVRLPDSELITHL